jgi:hypothetical protein
MTLWRGLPGDRGGHAPSGRPRRGQPQHRTRPPREPPVDVGAPPDALHTMVALAASQLEGWCGHDPADDPLEGCWQHPDAGLMCPACSIEHRVAGELHPWGGEDSADVCDVCGVDPAFSSADCSGLDRWPSTRRVAVPFRSLGRDAVWPVTVCEACADWPSASGAS